MGLVKGVTAKLHVDPNAKAHFCKARQVPYALRGHVEAELNRLEKAGVIEKVEFAEWAAPIVPIVKLDGSVRICGDYKITVNRVAKVDNYPLPRIEDLFASLTGGKHFSKLDLAHAYQQIPLHEDSKQYVVINTHKGLYQYNRLHAFWGGLCSSNLPEDNGRRPTRNRPCHGLPRGYLGNREE